MSILVQDFVKRCRLEPDGIAFRFEHADGATETLTRGELLAAVNVLADELCARVTMADRVILLFPPGLDFVVAFWATIVAGAVAVPVPVPAPGGLVAHGAATQRRKVILEDARPKLILARDEFSGEGLDVPVHTVNLHELRARGEAARRDCVDADDATLALLQYTSGSTAQARGVKVSAANISANVAAIAGAFRLSASSVGAIWLPHYHDMGLIGGVVVPPIVGFPVTLVAPQTIIRRPARWLDLIARTGATVSGGPNFAYELCVARVPPEERSRYDLSRWEVAFTGAEPIRALTLERFGDAFAGSGFRRTAFVPCYGLAETTLLVSATRPGAGPEVRDTDAHRRLVGCGKVDPGTDVVIVDPATRTPVHAEHVGEIWVAGPSVAAGYWSHDGDDDPFSATTADGGGPYLRTGDLGFFDAAGELFVSGRAKDVIIQNGVNHHAEDVEDAAFALGPAVRGAAAFAREGATGEEVVLLVELKRLAGDAGAGDAARIVELVAEATGIVLAEVQVLPVGSLPRTPSGKVRRGEAKQRYVPVPREAANAPPHSAMELWLCGAVSDLCDIPRNKLAVDVALVHFGLDSVRTLALAGRINERFGRSLRFASGLSVREIATRIEEASSASRAEGPAFATGTQLGILAMQRRFPTSGVYNLARAFVVEPAIATSTIIGALATIAGRHEAFSVAFEFATDPPRIVHAPGHRLTLPEATVLAPLSEALPAFLRARADAPFDLAAAPLFRAELIRATDGRRILLLTAHHLVTDLHSLFTIIGEFRAILVGQALPPVRTTGRPSSSPSTLAWWKATLADAPPVLVVPGLARPRSAGVVQRAQTCVRTSTSGLATRARACARTLGVSPFAVVLAGFATVLGRLAGEDTFLVGLFASMRDGATHAAVDCLSNLVVWRCAIDRDASFAAAVACVAASAGAAAAHADEPFASVARLLPDGIRVVLGYQDATGSDGAFDAALALGTDGPAHNGLAPIAIDAGDIETEVTIGIALAGEELVTRIDFAAELHLDDEIATLAEKALAYLNRALADPERRVEAISATTEREEAAAKHRLVEDRLRLATEAWARRTLPPAIDAWLGARPDAIALTDASGVTTYGELARRSRAIAAGLQRANVQRGARVALRADPSVGMVAAMIGILRAGAAYVPVPPEIPFHRAAQMIAASEASLVVLGAEQACDLVRFAIPAAVLDELEGDDFVPPECTPDDTAYVMFTSGTSGQSKGVVVDHGNVTSFLAAVNEVTDISVQDRVLSLQTIAFDISVLEIFLPLATGASVVIAPPAVRRDGALLAQFLAAHEISVVQATPTTWSSLLATGWRAGHGLRAISGGEPLPLDLAHAIVGTGARLLNLYGPTEATVWSSATAITADARRVTIGTPLANATLHVLDAAGVPVEDGVRGELCIGGHGVACDYAGDPAATAARFVPDSFLGGSARLYRTGDMVRRLPDGTVLYLGRNDRQMKLRGHRVEPEEIEAVLREVDGVTDGLVDVEDGTLIAFLRTSAPTEGLLRRLRDAVAHALPSYMHPNRWFVAPRFPETVGGKIDRCALREEAAELAREATAPPVSVDDPLGAIWREVLGVEALAGDSDFFELGGHSIKLMALANRIRERMGVAIEVADLWRAPAFAAMAEIVARMHHDGRRGPRAQGSVTSPLVGAQRRIWVAHQLDASRTRFAIPLLVHVEGDIEPARMERALAEALGRHRVLASVVVERDGDLWLESGPPPSITTTTGDAEEALDAFLMEPFDLAHGPLARACWLPDGGLFALAIHHLVIDAASIGLLFDDIVCALRGEALAPPVLSFADYATWKAAAPPPAADDEAFWARALDGWSPVAFPFARGGADEEILLPVARADALRRAAAAARTSLMSVVVALMQAAIALETKQTDVTVALDVSDRDRRELDPLVGLLVDEMPLRSRVASSATLAETIAGAAATMRDALAHRTPFESVQPILGREPINVKVAEMNVPAAPVSIAPKLTLVPSKTNIAAPRHHLTLFVLTGGRELVLQFVPDPARVGTATVNGIRRSLERLLDAFLARPSTPLGEVGAVAVSASAAVTADVSALVRDAPLATPSGHLHVLVPVDDDVDLASWLVHDRARVDALYADHGAILFRGFGIVTPSRFGVVAKVLDARAYSTGEHPPLKGEPGVYRAVIHPSHLSIPWHNEDCHLTSWPRRVTFACVVAPERGGLTTLTDCAAVWKRLDPALTRRLERTGVRYQRVLGGGLGLGWREAFQLDDRAAVEARCRGWGFEHAWLTDDRLRIRWNRPASVRHPEFGTMLWFNQITHFHPAMIPEVSAMLAELLPADELPRNCWYGDGEPIGLDAIAEIVATFQAFEFGVPWERGDVLTIDNMRLAHARTPYDGPRQLLIALAHPMLEGEGTSLHV